MVIPLRALPLVVPRAIPLARPLPAVAPRPVTPLLTALDDGAGLENLEDTLEEVGGFSTKDVSVVLQLDQQAIHLVHALKGKSIQEGSVRVRLWPRVEIAGPEDGSWEQVSTLKGFSDWRLRNIVRVLDIYPSYSMLASKKSTQNAFIFNPYRKAAKLSENRDKLSCMSCMCMKLASKSDIASLSSAN